MGRQLALFAVIAWAIASLGFSLYLGNFADRGLTYGASADMDAFQAAH